MTNTFSLYAGFYLLIEINAMKYVMDLILLQKKNYEQLVWYIPHILIYTNRVQVKAITEPTEYGWSFMKQQKCVH